LNCEAWNTSLGILYLPPTSIKEEHITSSSRKRKWIKT
jgi:hypothetical protein